MMQSNVNEICSIKDLLNILNSLGEVEQGKTRFFRGHSKSSYLMQPSIYRESYLIENEDKIIRDALTYCPDDFSPNDTLFQKLVKLQHYGYATRLLDLTTNILVALYFAASAKEDEDGELIILDIPNEEIKYGDSDTVAILSSIALLSCDKNIIISDYVNISKEYARKQISTVHQEYITKLAVPKHKEIFDLAFETALSDEIKLHNFSNFRKVTQNFSALYAMSNSLGDRLKVNPELQVNDEEINKFMLAQKELYMEYIVYNYQKIFIEYVNKNKDIFYIFSNLLDVTKEDKPYFLDKINPFDLRKVICVRAKLNNARIVRQQGCFLLFGIQDSKEMPAVMPSEWKREIDGQKIIIKNKQHIMQELKSFGISKQTLFPELERQAEEIMAQYEPK